MVEKKMKNPAIVLKFKLFGIFSKKNWVVTYKSFWMNISLMMYFSLIEIDNTVMICKETCYHFKILLARFDIAITGFYKDLVLALVRHTLGILKYLHGQWFLEIVSGKLFSSDLLTCWCSLGKHSQIKFFLKALLFLLIKALTKSLNMAV